MIRHSSRLLILLLICIMLIMSAAAWIGINLFNRSQQIGQKLQGPIAPVSQWVSVPPGTTPTIPANGYLFKNSMGKLVIYYPPATPPATLTWASYHNEQDRYTIDYPTNWIKSESSDRLAFYPPGTNLNENIPGGPEGIILRWTKIYQPPAPTDPTFTSTQSITVNGVTGKLYTHASLGVAIIAAFGNRGGTLLLTADGDSDVLIYAFQHMLDSLKFL